MFRTEGKLHIINILITESELSYQLRKGEQTLKKFLVEFRFFFGCEDGDKIAVIDSILLFGLRSGEFPNFLSRFL